MREDLTPDNTALYYEDENREAIIFTDKRNKKTIGKPIPYSSYLALSRQFQDLKEFKQFLLDLPDDGWDWIHMIQFFDDIYSGGPSGGLY